MSCTLPLDFPLVRRRSSIPPHGCRFTASLECAPLSSSAAVVGGRLVRHFSCRLGLGVQGVAGRFHGRSYSPDVLAARAFYQRSWKSANVADIYFQHRHLVDILPQGFLVRGIVYDMPSLIQKEHKIPANIASRIADPAEKYDVMRRDWSSMLLDFDTDAQMKKVDDMTVSADQVMESLGLKAVVPGLQNRVGTMSTGRKDIKPKSKLEEKQALEEVMGRGDSIRAKYAAKIFQKKMLAEARREQAKLGIFPTAAPKASSKGWRVMPGAPALVRYLEERGLKQALVARGSEEDLACLLDQLGNFKFQHITHVSNGSDELALGEPFSNERLKRICLNWALHPKQVMVVIGGGEQGEAALAATGDLGFFVCRVNNSPPEQNQGIRFTETPGTIVKTAASKKGIVSWFTQLREGTLHAVKNHDSRMQHLFLKGHVHFSVTDMVGLKWVIEDLNGVSYRKSTLISGFQDLELGAKQL